MSAQGISEGQGERPLSVFLSYAREDQARAEQLIAALEASGFKVWWDGLIMGGAEFSGDIERALETADAVVVIWSEASGASHWVRDEAERGRDRGRLVPVTFIGALPPLGFRQIQAVDFAGWAGAANARPFSALKEAIEAVAKGREVEARTVVRRAAGMPRRRMLLAGGGAALAAAGGGLGAWQAGWFDPEVPENSIAVLPFKNLSGDKDQDYLADGISEEIRLQLMRNSGLRVMAPASTSFALVKTKSQPQFARMLDVSLILNGSVRTAEGKFQVAATLVEADSGFSVWSDRLEGPLTEILKSEDRISDSVVSIVNAQFPTSRHHDEFKREAAESASVTGGTKDLEAFTAYKKGAALYDAGQGAAAYRSAIAQLDRALESDSKFADALALRAYVLMVLANASENAQGVGSNYDEALENARRAIAVAPSASSGYNATAYVLLRGYQNFREAGALQEKARNLDPKNPSTQSAYAVFAAQTGRRADAKIAIERAIALDPFNADVLATAAKVYNQLDDHLAALTLGTRALELNPLSDYVRFQMGVAQLMRNQTNAAQALFEEETATSPRLAGLAICAFRLGNQKASTKYLDEIVEKRGDLAAYQQALVLAQTGQFRASIAKLFVAKEKRDAGLSNVVSDPLLAPLRKNPEFLGLLTELGFD